MRRMRQFGWAAIVLVIVGAGVVEARKFMPMAPADTPPASNVNAVLSQEESPSRDAPTAATAPLAKTDSRHGSSPISGTHAHAGPELRTDPAAGGQAGGAGRSRQPPRATPTSSPERTPGRTRAW